MNIWRKLLCESKFKAFVIKINLMHKHPTQFLIAALTFAFGISTVVMWFYYIESQKVKVELPDAHWEKLFFELINRTTEIGGLEKLREISLKDGDFEVRVWRGFGLGDFEGVILKRTNNQLKAFHVKADHYVEPQQVVTKELNPPKSGWDSFWKNITELGLLKLRDPSEKNCEDDGIDGTGYVVEINQNKIYRTYKIRESGKCNGVRQMENIDDLIGEEFDSGQEQCKKSEWFACAKLRKLYRQNQAEFR